MDECVRILLQDSIYINGNVGNNILDKLIFHCLFNSCIRMQKFTYLSTYLSNLFQKKSKVKK